MLSLLLVRDQRLLTPDGNLAQLQEIEVKNLRKVLPLLLGAFLAFSSSLMWAQKSDDLSPFVGRWQINLSKSSFNRYGPNGKNPPRPANYTFVFAPEGQDLKLTYYNEYPQKPARSMTIVVDQKPHPCTGDCIAIGNTAPDTTEQTYTYTWVDSHMVTRVTYAKGKINEYLFYAVTPDGKTLMQVNWNPETPDWQNVYVFDKQP